MFFQTEFHAQICLIIITHEKVFRRIRPSKEKPSSPSRLETFPLVEPNPTPHLLQREKKMFVVAVVTVLDPHAKLGSVSGRCETGVPFSLF